MKLTCEICHKCHQGWRTYSRCRFPSAVWIIGNGPIAVLAWCDVLTVSLRDDMESATATLDWIARSRCGHACTGNHNVVDVRAVAHPITQGGES